MTPSAQPFSELETAALRPLANERTIYTNAQATIRRMGEAKAWAE